MRTARPLPAGKIDDAEKRQRLRLLRSENVGPTTFQRLLVRFGRAEAALAALPGLAARGGLRRTLRIASVDEADQEWLAGHDAGAVLIASGEPGYPPLLAHIPAAPPLLWVRGDAAVLDRPAIAVVGSRNASANGRQIARRLAGELGERGLAVVSGFARGIDTAAHEASAPTGTVAVFAGGIGHVYPPENAELVDTICRTGAVVSERAPFATPRGQDFPARNRIISGMAWGTVVVEAAARSGTLITARYALEQGREVFAVPGTPADPRAAGTNGLLKSGATLVTDAHDILSVVEPMMQRGLDRMPGLMETDAGPPPDVPVEGEPGSAGAAAGLGARLLDLAGFGETTLDALIREAGAPAGAVQAALLELELAGRITRTREGAVRRVG